MKLGRSSIATIMGLVVILAVDFAWLRVVTLPPYRSVGRIDHALNLANGFLFDFGLIGMFSLLALGLLRLASSVPERRPFLIGFQWFGLPAMFLYWMICCRWGAWLLPEPRYQHGWGVFRVLKLTIDAMRAVGIEPEKRVHWFSAIALIVVLTLPQFIFAYAGAFVVRHITRRRAVEVDS